MMSIRASRNRHTLRRWLAWVALGLVLMATFWAYTRPGFMAALVDDLWTCF